MTFHTTQTCPFCGHDHTRLYWEKRAIVGIKHMTGALDMACRGTAVGEANDVIPHTRRFHKLVMNYERLMEHLRDEAFVRQRDRAVAVRADFVFGPHSDLGLGADGLPAEGEG